MVTILYLINESKEQKVCLFWEVVDTVCMRCKQQLYNNYFWGYFCTLLSQLNFSIKMCGSLLSKFKFSNNKIDPAWWFFPEPRRVESKMKLANQDAAYFQDREFWKHGEQQGKSSVHSLAAVRSKSSPSDDSSRSLMIPRKREEKLLGAHWPTKESVCRPCETKEKTGFVLQTVIDD